MTALGNLLKWVLGTGNVSAASGTTISGAGSTTTTFTTAASGTFDPGSMFRLGAIGDGDGEGQWYVVDSHTLTNLVSEVAAPGAPANGAVVYSAETVGTVETDCAISTGKRFLIQTADNQYVVHGCYPSAISFSGTNPGEMLVATITVTGSWFEPVSATFPSAVAASMTSTPSPNAQGSVNFQTYATTTRNALSIRQCAITVNLGTQAVYGLDTVGQYQRICGAKRTPTTVTVSLTVDAAGASTTPTYWTDFLTNGAKHLLISFATAAGQAAGMYLAWCRYSGKRPTQASVDNLNRVQFQVTAGTDTAESTDDLSLSALRIGLG